MREVADVTLFHWYGEDLAPRFHHRAHAGGRQTAVANALGIHLHELRPQFRKVSREVHLHRPRLLRGRLEQRETAELLDDDGPWSRGCRLEVEPVVLDRFLSLL